ncbi:MAG TPA: xanthine dehydrogenase family protein subunit M, partial [Ardenticatenaceae bacterium]|nr:xanthine dehydrogenase family protein subunit M [Ardenticatenaceae bacterium]
MYPAPFDYAAPSTIDEALQLLSQNQEARVLAGGHSLLPAMKLRLSSPSMLVDLRKIDGLRGMSFRPEDGGLRIGAMTTYAEILANQDLVSTHPALYEAVEQVGDLQVRNCGTIGGSIAHNDPAADLPAVVLALEATINTLGPGGSRGIPAEQFIVGLFETALQPGEIITSIDFPPRAAGSGSAYEKFENAARGYAITGIAAVLIAGAGAAHGVRVAVT